MSLLGEEHLQTPLSIDEILPLVGEFSKYQIFLQILCISVVPASMARFSPYFVQHDPGWQCVSNSTVCKLNGTITSSSQQYKDRCSMPRSEWQFAVPDKEYSVVTQFDIYCDMEPYNLLATSMVFISWAIGAVVLGWLADKYGRKIIFIISQCAVMILGLISAFSPSFVFYAVARVVIGFFIPGTSVQMFVLISEFVGPKFRPQAGITLWFAFSLSIALMGLKAYFIRTWKLLIILCTAPYFIVFLFFPWVPESLRWLSLHGKADVAMQQIHRVAKMNGRDIPQVTLAKFETDSSKNSGNILNIFRPKKMAVNSLVQGFAWIVNALVYYGVSFAAADLGGSMYRDYVLLCLVEIPGIVLAIYLCKKIGRKKTVMFPMLIGGIACIAASLITTKDKTSKLIPFRIFLGIMGKMCITISYDSIYTWSIELYPTIIRSAAMGYLQIAARIGSALAPWVAKWLIGVNAILPFSLMGGVAIVCSLTLVKLPETAFKPTAETFDDLDKSYPENKKEKQELVEMTGNGEA